MVINVTQKNIDDGEEGACSKCPIALAIQDIYGFPVMIGWNKVKKRVKLEGRGEDFGDEIGLLPLEVVDKMYRFDRGFGMKPFRFKLI